MATTHNNSLAELSKTKIVTVTDCNSAIPSEEYKQTYICDSGSNTPVSGYVFQIEATTYRQNSTRLRISQQAQNMAYDNLKVYIRNGVSTDNGSTYLWSEWTQL